MLALEWAMLAVVVGLIIAGVATGAVRHLAVRTGAIDQASERSMHSGAIPRGGGLAIIGVTLAACVLAGLHTGEWRLPLAVMAGGALVGFVGWIDDHGHVSPAKRAAVHLLAGGIAAAALASPLQSAPMVALVIASAIAIAYFVNLFNFMDGLDGLAGSEGAFIGLSTAALHYAAVLHAKEVWRVECVLIVAAALGGGCLGFLLWNWPPAKIFLGDVGSGFLGLVYGALLVNAWWLGEGTFWPMFVLAGLFVADATVTLATRMLTGQRWYEAHRSHAYQKAALRFGNHRRVTLAFVAINVLWLLPLALAARILPSSAALIAAVAYTPLVALALAFRAGLPDSPVTNATTVAE